MCRIFIKEEVSLLVSLFTIRVLVKKEKSETVFIKVVSLGVTLVSDKVGVFVADAEGCIFLKNLEGYQHSHESQH